MYIRGYACCISQGEKSKRGKLCKKAQEVKPQIMGLAGILTLAFNSIKGTVETLEATGLRENVKILGGTSVRQEALFLPE